MKTAKLGQAQTSLLLRYSNQAIATVRHDKPEQRILTSLHKRGLIEVVERTGKRIDKIRVVTH